MKKQIFPIEIIDNSTEKLIKSNSIKTYIIYNIVLLFVLVTLLLTFFIKIDINIISPGIIKTPGERITINSPHGAFINELCVKENDLINNGDTILLFNLEQLNNELAKNIDRIQEVSDYIKDLQLLVQIENNDNQRYPILITSTYTKSLNYYISQYANLKTKVNNILNNHTRHKRLLEYGDIAKSEFELVKTEYDNLRLGVDLYYSKQINEWQVQLDNYIVEHRELQSQITQINIKADESVVISPVAGIIQKIEGVGKGSYVQQGQKLFEISLDSHLFVECMIPPKDIGYIKIEQDVRMQIDAFNYNEWGVIKGKVVEIFNDVTLVNTSSGILPYFKVICSIDKPYLRLKNGYKGDLKRGMTISARFKITERTVFQLMYDKIDNWMNPNINNLSNN